MNRLRGEREERRVKRGLRKEGERERGDIMAVETWDFVAFCDERSESRKGLV